MTGPEEDPPDFGRIPGWLTLAEGRELFRLARHGPGDGAVVEVGSYQGRSTAYLAEGCRRAGRGPVYAVDHHRGSPEHRWGGAHACPVLARHGSTLPAFRANLDGLGLGEWVTPVVADSAAAAGEWRGPVRLLFLDGDHDYPAVCRDFDGWSPFLEATGLLCLHDVDAWDGPTRLCAELQGEGWRVENAADSLRVLRRE